MQKRLTGAATVSAAAPPFVEFVVLIALMTGLTAFSIDNLLPAFGPIGQEFRLADDNQVQLILYTYMIGFALMQLVYGPVADVVGRRPMVMVGLSIYAAGTLFALVAPGFTSLLVARIIQGM